MSTQLLTDQLWFLPPPGRAPIAEKLVAAGWQHHPELATKKAVPEPGTERMGNWRPLRLQPINAHDGVLSPPKVNPRATEEIAALATTLGFVPRESRADIATGFHQLGWRWQPTSLTDVAAAATHPGKPGAPHPGTMPSALAALRRAGTHVPELAELADRLEAALAAAEEGDTSLRDQLGAELLAGFGDAEKRLLAHREAGDMEPDKLEPDSGGH